ncbi:MAG: hypothetical protein ABIP21_01150, partial [Acidimicrobiia bacterium]
MTNYMIAHHLATSHLRAVPWSPPKLGYLISVGCFRATAGGMTLGAAYGASAVLVVLATINPVGNAVGFAIGALVGGWLGFIAGSAAGVFLSPLVARLVITRCANRHNVATVADRAFITGTFLAGLLAA